MSVWCHGYVVPGVWCTCSHQGWSRLLTNQNGHWRWDLLAFLLGQRLTWATRWGGVWVSGSSPNAQTPLHFHNGTSGAVCVYAVCVQCVHSVCVHVCSVRMCVCSTEGGRVEPGCPGPHVLPLPVSSAGSRQDTWSPRVMRSEAQVRERPPLGAEVPPSAFLPLRCLCLQVSTYPDHLSHVKPFWGHSFLSLLLLPGLPGYSRVVTGDLYV